jgi:hypothetical protein
VVSNGGSGEEASRKERLWVVITVNGGRLCSLTSFSRRVKERTGHCCTLVFQCEEESEIRPYSRHSLSMRHDYVLQSSGSRRWEERVRLQPTRRLPGCRAGPTVLSCATAGEGTGRYGALQRRVARPSANDKRDGTGIEEERQTPRSQTNERTRRHKREQRCARGDKKAGSSRSKCLALTTFASFSGTAPPLASKRNPVSSLRSFCVGPPRGS